MSNNILQVNYDEAGQIAQTLRAEAEEIARLHTQTRQRMEALQKDWRGEAGQTFQREMNDSVLPATLRASNALFSAERVLVEIVNIIRQADEETVGYFKGLGGLVAASPEAGSEVGSQPIAGGEAAPQNMQELAALVMKEGEPPIRIYPLGNNEYLVTINGTSHNPNDIQNWGSAIEAGLGHNTAYQDRLKEALMQLPEGATVHMAGYSQGGIVAQNLAGDGDVSNMVKIKSITTFGSPYSAPEVDGIKYQRFAAKGDLVPYLEGRDIKTAMLLTPFVGVGIATSIAGAHRHPQISIPGSLNPIAAHTGYEDSQALKSYALPFNTSEWNGQPMKYKSNIDEPNSPLAITYKYAGNTYKSGVYVANTAKEFAGNFVQSGAAAAQDIGKHAGNFFGNLL